MSIAISVIENALKKMIPAGPPKRSFWPLQIRKTPTDTLIERTAQTILNSLQDPSPKYEKTRDDIEFFSAKGCIVILHPGEFKQGAFSEANGQNPHHR